MLAQTTFNLVLTDVVLSAPRDANVWHGLNDIFSIPCSMSPGKTSYELINVFLALVKI